MNPRARVNAAQQEYSASEDAGDRYLIGPGRRLRGEGGWRRRTWSILYSADGEITRGAEKEKLSVEVLDVYSAGAPDSSGRVPLTAGSSPRHCLPLGSPFLVFLDTLSNAERGDLADQGERERLPQRKLDRSFGRGKFRQVFCEGFHT